MCPRKVHTSRCHGSALLELLLQMPTDLGVVFGESSSRNFPMLLYAGSDSVFGGKNRCKVSLWRCRVIRHSFMRLMRDTDISELKSYPITYRRDLVLEELFVLVARFQVIA